MYEHYIALDTETSGIPKSWDDENLKDWPCIIQLAWLVYTPDGKLVKEECHYLSNPGVKINPKSEEIHGISAQILEEQGVDKTTVLQHLFQDIKKYQALIIAHFAEFDLKLLQIEGERCQLDADLHETPFYCTMINSEDLNNNPARTFPSLAQLYQSFFGLTLQHQHHALHDSRAVADCFFEII